MDLRKENDHKEMVSNTQNLTKPKYKHYFKEDQNHLVLNDSTRNNFFQKIGKIENLQFQNHTCDNTTGESKTNVDNERILSYDHNLKLENERDKSLNESPKRNLNKITNLGLRRNTLLKDLDNKISFPLLGRKIFRIKKYTKYNKYLNEICTDSEITDEEKNKLKDPQSKKISPFSKVNFSKLKVEEKDERLKNLAKLVKRLRRKVRNLENKVRFNASKLLNKYVWTKLGINTKNKYVPPEFSFDFDKICRALKRVRNHDDFEFADQKHIIENLINMIAEDKLKLDSLSYKRICTQIRMLLNKEQIKYISKKNNKVTITFPETEVFITRAEYNKVKKFKEKEDILRAVLGVYDDQEERAVKISIETPIEQVIENQKTDYNLSKIKHDKNHQEGPKLENNSITENVSIKNMIGNNLADNNSSFLFDNIKNQNNLQDKINYILKNKSEESSANQILLSNNELFNNNISNVHNLKKFNDVNEKPYLSNEISSHNTFSNNLVFKPPTNNIEENPSQQFPINLMNQNSSQLLSSNCFSSFNTNLQNYLNPLQLYIFNNNNQAILNNNPEILNNILMKQNFSQMQNQNENNIYSNFNNGLNNNIFSNNAGNNNLFGEKINNINESYNKNNNPLPTKEKKNSSYNVFLK